MIRTVQYVLITVVILFFNNAVLAQTKLELFNENIKIVSLLDKSVVEYLKTERYYSDASLKNKLLIRRLLNLKAFSAVLNPEDEKKRIREEWNEFLGLDVFYPYFKAQEVENYVQEKSKVRLFNLQGKAEFNRSSKEVKYIFKKKF